MKTLELNDTELAKLRISCEIMIDSLVENMKEALYTNQNMEDMGKDVQVYQGLIEKIEAVFGKK